MSDQEKKSDFELRRQLLQMEMLHEIGVALNTSLDPIMVAEEILNRALVMVDARGAMLLVRDEGQQAFFLAGQAGSEGEPGEILELPELAQAWGEAKVVVLKRNSKSWQHICIMPLQSQEEISGLLVVADREDRDGGVGAFTEGDQSLLRSFAFQAGTALRNARLHRDLQDAYEQLQRAQRKLAQLEQLRALGELAAEVAHSMGHVLGIIVGRADMYMHFRQDPNHAMENILEAAEQGRKIIARIQQTTRLGVAKKRESCDLNTIVRQVVEEIQALWEERLIAEVAAIEWQTELGVLQDVMLNPGDIKELLRNLVLNGLEAMPNGGCLQVETLQRDDEIVIRVIDTGMGMSEEVKQRLFEPFFTTKDEVGNGLGLSIVYRIVEDHGGQIDVQSQEGEGTTFELLLPVRKWPATSQKDGDEHPDLDR